MKKRNPAAVLLLPFVTLGIYCIYWLYDTRRELVARNGQANSIPPVSILFAPFLLLIALFFFAFIVSWNSDGGALGVIATILLGIVGVAAMLVVPLWWFWQYCQVSTNTTKSMDFSQMYVLYIAITWLCNLFPVWMLIMQLEFNKLADREAAEHTPEHPHHEQHAHHEAHHHAG
ncbi:MAG TPA: DUF4234 domain-containing protein [Patescibacteria group bacterium]|nr:DUF4234 domain-containing protein [Patescibacteria group bacterium]